MLIPYISVKKPHTFEKEIKKSLFIAQLIPVHTEKEAEEALAGIRKTYKDATHNCWAMRTGTKRIYEKSGDDGEPQGTAGHPMLRVLQMKELTNVLAVVTRYFGGIKLGAGGLTRAYGGTLAELVATAPLVRYTPHTEIKLTLPYTAAGTFEHYIGNTDIRIEERTFTDTVTVKLLCLPENKEKHIRTFRDMTGGQAEIEETGETYVPMDLKEI